MIDPEIQAQRRARLIAFYLPQFHPIPENDLWWGKGFTEWRNVALGKPLFRGHYQPHVPADLGYYDLRLAETRIAQANLASQYGIEAFCYWHYWFAGKRLLERPFNEVLTEGQPDFPFCLAWANETWSRFWDGHEHHVLQAQTYPGPEDDLAHFRCLVPAFKDARAFRIEGKPLFLIYRPTQLPDPKGTLDLWRNEAAAEGLPGLYLMAVDTAYSYHQNWKADVLASLGIRRSNNSASEALDWRGLGFDGVVEFQPNVKMMRDHWLSRALKRAGLLAAAPLAKLGWLAKKNYRTLDYRKSWQNAMGRELPGEERFPTVMPQWDNSSRRRNGGATIFTRSSPGSYERWLRHAIGRVSSRPADQRIVFINAWNEWAEGCHLEPDLEYGSAYLEATMRAVRRG